MTPSTHDQAAGSEVTAPGPDLDMILAIHGNDPDGFIGLCGKVDPDAPPRLDRHGKPVTWQNIGSIQVKKLREYFPAVREWLVHDSYMTVNTYYRSAPWKNKITGLPDVVRKEKDLRTLKLLYADIDCGRPEEETEKPGAGLTWPQAVNKAVCAIEEGVIPPPSIICRSGRGGYLLWILHDAKDPAKVQHAWPEKTVLYKECNKGLQDRLRAYVLPVDGIHDAARVLRIPGSIHRATGQRVQYLFPANKDGKGFTYSLPEVAAILAIPAIDGDLPEETRALAIPAKYRRVKNPGSAPLRSHGTMKLHALRAQDLLTLEKWRGGFRKRGTAYADGHRSPVYGRRRVLDLYARFLVGSLYAPKALRGTRKIAKAHRRRILKALNDMAANCIPAYPSPGENDTAPAAILDAVLAEYRAGKIRRGGKNATLCEIFGITADVARDLELKTIIPVELKIERDQARPLRSDIVGARREWLRNYILDRGGTWTARRVMNLSGFSPYPWNNLETARLDLEAIGFRRTSRGGRPRKAYKP